MSTHRLAIIEFHESISHNGREILQGGMRFKLVETYTTSDGFRSRLCDGLWRTKDEARVEMEKRIKG